ncbi:acyl-CoA N-acyltransferase [Lindgomyces ingoldianus]|uniref:Acyl-CoA N-acyltransferase n=1 Tax=Lindgomyces ingoldianus TaxID=673940 RepID=A0ACB6QBI9_9PLEO|nr:acyl-CoA N-acyltransferase [Lindgomyces ingoldianus]KAF2463505.1 acyl-CoA N-acyltransferase [Lindgomyces ingoldianus]
MAPKHKASGEPLRKRKKVSTDRSASWVRKTVEPTAYEIPPKMQSECINLLSRNHFVRLFLGPFWENLLSPPKALHISIRVELARDMTQEEFEACFHLVESTSSSSYKSSSIGWNPAGKKKEMCHRDMKYILVRAAAPSKHIVGFLSFMYTYDDPPNDWLSVLYIYEVHLEEELRGSGLGSQLLGIAEFLAKRAGITKTMLTVFTSNTRAMALYQKRGYKKDECSPADRQIRNKVVVADYRIMSKATHTDDCSQYELDKIKQTKDNFDEMVAETSGDNEHEDTGQRVSPYP